MVPIEQKDGDFPMPLPARCIGLGKRKWPNSCATITVMKIISFRSSFESPIKLCV
jgi:hypothetical protein